jgi:hypothetical protein
LDYANPEEVSADAGYRDEQNLGHLALQHCQLPRSGAGVSQPEACGRLSTTGKRSRKAAMARKMKLAGRRNPYRLRRQIVEPMF